MKKLLLILAMLTALTAIPVRIHAQTPSNNAGSIAEAQVLSVKDTGKINEQNKGKITKVTLKILSGKYKNKIFSVDDNAVPLPYQVHFKRGDHVIATISDVGNGTQTVFISDYDRKPQLLVLFLLFLGVTFAIARKQAVTSFIGMLISIYVIAQIIMPSILAGTNAFVITMIASLIIIPATYYPAHGFNRKTTIAVAGTFITLIIVAILSYVFTAWANLTGYSSEEAVFLQSAFGPTINILGLLLAGMLIGALAVLNDITVSQASVVASLKKSNQRLTTKQLYNHAMDVGKDHVASLVNTLILVYVGAAFPLVLLFYNTQTPVSLILNQEIIATELVRTFVASIGIVLAVPITTYLACRFGES